MKMKKFSIVSLFTMLLIGSIYSTQALAVGKGFYLQTGSGSATWDADFDSGFKSSFDSDTSHTGIGFVLDTATAKDKLFNYRLQVGYEKYEDKINGSSSKLKMKSLVIDQDFGFGLVRNKNIRFWLAPEIRIAFASGSPNGSNGYDVALVGFGLGPAVGINFHTSQKLSLALKVGYLKMNYSGAGNDNSSSSNNATYTVHENITFVNFSMLFK